MRICSGPGCLRVVPDNVRLCAECAEDKGITGQAKPSRWERSKSDPIMAEFSTSRWARFRKTVMQHFLLCAQCGINVAKVADHKIPARLIVAVCRYLKLFPFDRWGGFYIKANLQGLCHSCHNAKTKVEDTQDWTDELVRVLTPYMKDADVRERVVEAIDQGRGCSETHH